MLSLIPYHEGDIYSLCEASHGLLSLLNLKKIYEVGTLTNRCYNRFRNGEIEQLDFTLYILVPAINNTND